METLESWQDFWNLQNTLKGLAKIKKSLNQQVIDHFENFEVFGLFAKNHPFQRNQGYDTMAKHKCQDPHTPTYHVSSITNA